MDIEFKQAVNLFDDRKFLQACEKFKSLLNNGSEHEQSTRDSLLNNISSCLACEGRYDEALKYLEDGLTEDDKTYLVQYNRALCYYKLSKLEKSLVICDKLVKNILRDYGDFTSSDKDGIIDMAQIEDSLIVQAINLQFAINQQLDYTNETGDQDCLSKVPFKNIGDYDPITLHNSAIILIDDNLDEPIDKLTHLINIRKQLDVPRETYGNLILLYIENGQNDSAQRMLSEFGGDKLKDSDLIQFLEIITQHKGNKITGMIIKKLEQLARSLVNPSEEIQSDLFYTITSYIIMLHWSEEDFDAIEELLIKFKKFFPSNDQFWLTNMAASYFMMGDNFDKASQIYEELLPAEGSDDFSLLDVDPNILANLCVSYVMTGQNVKAESLIKEIGIDHLMRQSNKTSVDALIQSYPQNITKVEDYLDSVYHDNIRPLSELASKDLSLSIVNIIIGNLYCVKNNYQFGLNRIFKAMEPIRERLTTETWLMAKRCILSLLDSHCRQIINVYDHLFEETISFLIDCEEFGLLTKASPQSINNPKNSVSYEARYLRQIILKLYHDC